MGIYEKEDFEDILDQCEKMEAFGNVLTFDNVFHKTGTTSNKIGYLWLRKFDHVDQSEGTNYGYFAPVFAQKQSHLSRKRQCIKKRITTKMKQCERA